MKGCAPVHFIPAATGMGVLAGHFRPAGAPTLGRPASKAYTHSPLNLYMIQLLGYLGLVIQLLVLISLKAGDVVSKIGLLKAHTV